MTITEAVKSGRPFTRSGWPHYLRVVADTVFHANADPMKACGYSLTASDLTADDWFLEPPVRRKVKKTGWVRRFRIVESPDCDSELGMTFDPMLDQWVHVTYEVEE